MPTITLEDIPGLHEFDAGEDEFSGAKKPIEMIVGPDNTASFRTKVGGLPKYQLQIDILVELASQCWELDPKAKAEAAAGVVDDEGLPAGGVMAVSWGRGWRKMGDLNPMTLEHKLAELRFDETTTLVMQMVAGMKQVYHDEFCVDEETGKPTPVDERPGRLLCGITDGACRDNAEFEAWAETLGGDTFLVMALVGDPEDDDYKQAAAEYGAIAAKNPHFVLILVGMDRSAVQRVPEAFLRLSGQYGKAA